MQALSFIFGLVMYNASLTAVPYAVAQPAVLSLVRAGKALEAQRIKPIKDP